MEGNWKAAGLHFRRATELKPENPESHNNLGLFYMLNGQTDQAIEQFKRPFRIKDSSSIETNLGNAYEHVKRYDDAIRTYKHALELDPNNASAHCDLGYALMQQGRIDEAIPEFMATIEEDPRMPQGRADLMQALRMKGINPDGPIAVPAPGTYRFDLQRALDLLRHTPAP